ncbi:MAG: single-stranded-DNA-specific exonuclease RecJ [Clostridia bacterium]|nr:single-stranded-DNA-specific exonuclease RecJ [Clostridia bacterium]
MSIKKWNVKPVDKALALELAEDCGIDAFTALLMCRQGVSDPCQIEEFLSDEIILPDPFAFTDMDKAVERIKRAVDSFEKIAIFGDYDADGVTATTLIYTCLEKMGAAVQYRLPLRDEGYGMSCDAIDELKAAEVSLIITVDNGIAAFDEIEYAKKCGIDVVVTDHHLPPENIPDAVAVVDPHRADCISEFKDYAGVGVAFMLACALNDSSCEEMLSEYGDLVTLGTIADVMPLVGDNRAIVKGGLSLINTGHRVGIKALCEAAGITGKEIESTTVAFGLAPRINAAGRMGNPDKAVKLLLCDDADTACELAQELNDLNVQRQQEEARIFSEAEQQLLSDARNLCSPVLVVWGENWHHGVVGIVAARLTQKYLKPSIVFSVEGDEASGSARSYKGVSIYELIAAASKYTVKFGGHETAAGLTCNTDDLQKFADEICGAAIQAYGQLPFCELDIACKLNPKGLSLSNVYAQEQLKPFGNGNELPIYGLFNMTVTQINSIGNGKHLRITLCRDGASVTAVKFSSTCENLGFVKGDRVDVAVTLDKNIYQGNENLSVIIKEIRSSDVDSDKLMQGVRDYENYCRFSTLPSISVPDRNEIAEVYKAVRNCKSLFVNEDSMCVRLNTDNYTKTRIILDILCELQLIQLNVSSGLQIDYIPTDKKVDLESSHILRTLKYGEVQE